MTESPPSRWKLLFRFEALLLLVLVLEIAVFCRTGQNFATRSNLFEVIRLSTEIALLALVMTPVILTGGIDLSVGSLVGLSAILFGKLWRDAHLPVMAAALGTVVAGALAGALNGGLITRLKLPPLIVTLGTFSLFRGLAEAITHGVDNFTRFPPGFLFLGQGYWLGVVPVQSLILLVVAVLAWVIVHHTTVGRSFRAIGFAPEGARYAGLPVERRLFFVYLFSGAISATAALVYVARVGQAKADAGTGYELLAITAVILGGTSIFGGTGTITGTLLGVAALGVLRNGLTLSDQPSELAGILTGGLLLAVLAGEAAIKKISARRAIGASATVKAMKPGIWVVLACASVCLSSGCGKKESSASVPEGGVKTLIIAMMPKSVGNAYFISCRKGGEEAAKELGAKLLWAGPTEPDPAKQNEIVETWITRGVDVMAVAAENREGISTALRKARQKGIKVITWDSDAEADARDFLVNQATPQGIGSVLMEEAAKVLGGTGEFAIITASLTAANMNEWQKYIEQARASRYPGIKMVALRPCDDLKDKAFAETTAILSAHPSVKLIMAICSPAVPGAAEAVKQSGRQDVKVVGLGLPKDNKRYVEEGITPAVILWNTADLGYLTVRAAASLAKGELKSGATQFQGGRLGQLEVKGDNILLGKPFVFTKENIGQFDF